MCVKGSFNLEGHTLTKEDCEQISNLFSHNQELKSQNGSQAKYIAELEAQIQQLSAGMTRQLDESTVLVYDKPANKFILIKAIDSTRISIYNFPNQQREC